MSSETFAWAKEQRCGDPVTKAVLMEIANWAKPTGVCEFLSVARIAEVTEVSRRTVQRHIMRLESTDKAAGGLGMIRRLARHRDDGGQSANSFELIGYEPPAVAREQKSPRRQPVTPPRHDDAPPRQSDTEPYDNRVTRLGDKIIIPPSNPDGLDCPPRKKSGASPDRPAAREIPEDWSPQEFGLGWIARSIIDGWPPGELAAQVEHFVAHHRSRANRFKNPQDAWKTWVLNSRKFGNHGRRGQNDQRNHPSRAAGNLDDEISNPIARVVAERQADRAAAERG